MEEGGMVNDVAAAMAAYLNCSSSPEARERAYSYLESVSCEMGLYPYIIINQRYSNFLFLFGFLAFLEFGDELRKNK